jgi:hypothetical protein
MEVSDSLRQQREARFREGVEAFIRRDFNAFDRAMRPDVVMQLPGTSWLAGTYQGPEEVIRCILGLRQVLDSTEDNVSFFHAEDRLIVNHEIRVHSPRHDIEMVFSVSITFDADERVGSIMVEPEDLGLFDHVLKTALMAFDASRFA